LAYQVKARGIQKKSMMIPIVIRMFDVRLESFMEGLEYTRKGAWS
jgi:purine nucleoside permease